MFFGKSLESLGIMNQYFLSCVLTWEASQFMVIIMLVVCC
jgi:hypothetical protein